MTYELMMMDDEFVTVMSKYNSYIMKLIFIYAKANARHFREVEVEVYSGLTGTGKSRKALYNDDGSSKGAYVMSKDSQSLWWDGYEGEKYMVWDDFHWDQVNIAHILRLLDGHPLKLPIKGGFCWCAWTKVVITTNIPVDAWYPLAEPAHRDALMRRLNNIENFE